MAISTVSTVVAACGGEQRNCVLGCGMAKEAPFAWVFKYNGQASFVDSFFGRSEQSLS